MGVPIIFSWIKDFLSELSHALSQISNISWLLKNILKVIHH